MAVGTLALAWLLAAPLPADVFPMRTREFKIPIDLDPVRQADIKQLLLYVSHDEGKTWGLQAKAEPTQKEFPFFADKEGSYWFTICVVDRQNKQDPPEAAQGKVGPKVLVDTTVPVLHVTAERQGDGVTVHWDITEDNPNLSTLKLEYRTADPPGGQWVTIPVAEPGLKGQTVVARAGSGPLNVRLQLQDVAGNHGSAQADVPPGPPAPPPSGGGTIVTSSSGSPVGSPVTSGPTVPDRGDSWAPTGGGIVPVTQTTQPGIRSVDAIGSTRGSAGSPSPFGSPGGGPVLATTGTGPRPGPGQPQLAPQPPARLVRGSLPPLQVINTNRITLDYEVGKFGASGVGSVELYVTRNDGQTWERWAGEQPPAVPAGPDGPGGPSVHRSLTAELQGEGTYGFFLIARSGVNRGRPAPSNGEAPQVRVEVDMTPPQAQLYPLEPVSGRRDALLIRWTATDRNLGPTPILLEWCERKEGQWQTIGPGELPNRGEYIWQIPPSVPAEVFLRLTVRDTAGNVGVAETDQKVTIDLSEPEVSKVRIGQPASR